MKKRIINIIIYSTTIILSGLLIFNIFNYFQNKKQIEILNNQLRNYQNNIAENQEKINILNQEIDLNKIDELEKENELWEKQISIIDPYLD